MVKKTQKLSLESYYRDRLFPHMQKVANSDNRERWGQSVHGIKILPYSLNRFDDSHFNPFNGYCGSIDLDRFTWIVPSDLEESTDTQDCCFAECKESENAGGFYHFSVNLHKTDKDNYFLNFLAGLDFHTDLGDDSVGGGVSPLFGGGNQEELEEYLNLLRKRTKFRRTLDIQFLPNPQSKAGVDYALFLDRDYSDASPHTWISYPSKQIYSQEHLERETEETLQRLSKVFETSLSVR